MLSILKPRSSWRLAKAAFIVILIILAFIHIVQSWLKIQGNQKDKLDQYIENVQLEKLKNELNRDQTVSKEPDKTLVRDVFMQ